MSTYIEEDRLIKNTLTVVDTMLDNHQFESLNTQDENVINTIIETLKITLSMINK